MQAALRENPSTIFQNIAGEFSISNSQRVISRLMCCDW
ncbi:hypothetical protein CSC33_1319 [Pseudomonas aeruginosa]|nr:hypothetical protein CSC33_1319 [Pseudomonas aeruginosa]